MNISDRIVEWIREQVRKTGMNGVVVGLSGGLDSTVTAILCRKAMGEMMLAAVMPCHGAPEDEQDANLVASKFGIPTIRIDLGGAFDTLKDILPEAGGMAVANLKPRLRMIALYYLANDRGYLVVGTGNRSEYEVGYTTKYGDSGADIFPLIGIYKTDLREIATELGVPARIVEKPPSAGLWEGQTDEEEMGISYDDLDRILKDLKAGREPRADKQLVERVKEMIATSEHKRVPPPGFALTE